MEFGSLICNQLSEVQVMECNLCALECPTNPMVTSCGHSFCWPCLYRFLKGRAKPPCPVCATILSSNVNVAPEFNIHGALVLRLPTVDKVETSCDDDMQLDWSGTLEGGPWASSRFEEETMAKRDRDIMAVVVFNEETKVSNGNGICV